MMAKKYMTVKITKCSSVDYWYTDQVGSTRRVAQWSPTSWGVEDLETGCQIAPHDYEVIN